jgi:hypothetical protein
MTFIEKSRLFVMCDLAAELRTQYIDGIEGGFGNAVEWKPTISVLPTLDNSAVAAFAVSPAFSFLLFPFFFSLSAFNLLHSF